MRQIMRVVAAVLTCAFAASAVPFAARGAAGEDARFAGLAHAYFYAGFKESPSGATSVGFHRYDAALDDLSARAVAAHIARDKAMLLALSAIDSQHLSPDVAIDRTMLVNSINDDLLLTETLQQWKHNPDMYTGIASGAVYSIIERNYAPLTVRMRYAIERERAVPRLLRQAMANITTVDAATKSVSLDDVRGTLGFFSRTVPQAFVSVKDAPLRAQLAASTRAALEAMRTYTAYIANIRPQGTFAIGKDAYEKRLQYEDALDMPVADYLAIGEAYFAKTRAQFVATAKLIDPSKTPQDVYASLAPHHPSPRALLAAASADLIKLRKFVIAHQIVTLPADADIKVIETPAFERAFITAQEDPPGPLETVATQAYYNVTPVDPSWPKARQEGFLAQFNDYQRPLISAHEVYPGHFTNYTIDKHVALSLTRRLLWNSEFGEGWAHYGEQMMVDEGWGNGDPRVRLAQLEEALLRECRYVAGVQLHTGGWSLQQAERLFTHQCFQSPAVALEETMRGTQDPMYGYYTLGKLMILKLRDDYRKKLGARFTLQRFHDALLAHGDPPVPLMRPLLLGNSDDGHQMPDMSSSAIF